MTAMNSLNGDCDKPPARRRRRRGSRIATPQLNIVSLIDVFAVLVFFLLSGASVTAAKLQALQLQMGQAQAAPAMQAPPEQLTLRLSSSEIRVIYAGNDKPFPAGDRELTGLSGYLQTLKAEYPHNDGARLEVADAVAYEDIVAVMAVLSHVDGGGPLFPNISLANIAASAAGAE